MMPDQRGRLQAMVVPGQQTWDLTHKDQEAIAAALADLDAARAVQDGLMEGWTAARLDRDECRAALRPVAKRLGDWRDWPCKASPCAVYLTEPEAAAVLAAAGDGSTYDK